METGTVKTFNAERGFGFITRPGQDDVFFHVTDVKGREQLATGDRVEFGIGEGRKGPKAINVTRIET